MFPLRVALFLPDLPLGGAERITLNLARGLLALGHDVRLLVGNARGPACIEVPPDLPVIDFRASRTAYAVLGLRHRLRVEPPDVVLAAKDHAVAAALVAAHKTHVPVIAIFHGPPSRTRATASLVRRTTWLVLRVLLPRSAAVVAVSHGVADDIATTLAYPRHRILVLPNPILPDTTTSVPDTFAPRHPWLDDPHTPVVLAAGRLHPEKGFDLLLRAFRRLLQQRKARLLVFGEGPDLARLRLLASDLGIAAAVDFPGVVPSLSSALHRAAAFVLPSRSEGLPTVLVEALDAGLPVVATDCHTGPREVLCDGRYGRLVPVDDADRLASALLDALNDQGPPADVTDWLRPYRFSQAIREYDRLLRHVCRRTTPGA